MDVEPPGGRAVGADRHKTHDQAIADLHGRATAAEERAAKLEKEAAQLGKDAEVARAQIAEAQARAAEANQKAEEERLARVKIEERLAPRSATPEQVAGIVTALAKFSGTPIAVWQAGEAPEIGGVALTTFAALQGAHWDANLWVWTGIGSFVGMTVVVQPDSDARIIEAADALAAALNMAGLRCTRENWPAAWSQVGGMHNGPNPPAPTGAPIRLIIGAKPAQ